MMMMMMMINETTLSFYRLCFNL